MAGEPWNRVNIPFPSAVSCVRIHFSRTTDVNVKSLLRENDNVRTLLSSKILQTEIRLLYELLYVLNNSYRGNKAFRALKQVEQCINRLKEMKLDVALQDLTDLCPTRMQRGVSVEVGECDVPSQPRLEWLCLKVLGAAQLMSRTLTCCSKAFILSKVQMKHEFLVLSVVITSMLCRLWVFFRGILDNLARLYRWLLEFLREVSQAKPMPFLTEFPLPADMAQFLGPSDAFLLTKTPSRDPVAKNHQEKQQKKKAAVKFTNKTRKEKEDLGVAVHRGQLFDIEMKPLLEVLRDFTELPREKSVPQKTHEVEKKQMFKKQVTAAATFTDMATHLQDIIPWCKSRHLGKERRLLSFLYLKCQKMKHLESAGYNVQRKLHSFKREACWASSPTGSVPRTCRPLAALWRNAYPRTRFQPLRTRFRTSTVRSHAKQMSRRRKRTKLSVSGLSEESDDQRDTKRSGTSHDRTSLTSDSESQDEIDDIFSSVGF